MQMVRLKREVASSTSLADYVTRLDRLSLLDIHRIKVSVGRIRDRLAVRARVANNDNVSMSALNASEYYCSLIGRRDIRPARCQ